MNKFEYRIYDSVYDDMINGKKTIEFRLLNKKSEKIQKGDEIKFEVVNDKNKSILVEVLDKYLYGSHNVEVIQLEINKKYREDSDVEKLKKLVKSLEDFIIQYDEYIKNRSV